MGLCSLAYAVKLPVSTMLFSSPLLMGSDAEPIPVSTWAGLFLVFCGFLWHVYAGQTKEEALEAEEAMLFTPGGSQVKYEEPWAFHERVVGCVSTAAVRRGEERSGGTSR